MPQIKKWICTAHPNDPYHMFDDPSEDGFCPRDPPWHGKLTYRTIDIDAAPGIKIRLLSPLDRSVFSKGDSVRMVAEASVEKGSIGKVEFLVNGRKVGEKGTAPYSLSWLVEQPGSYDITAVAWDRQGASKASPAAKINVKSDSVREIGLCVLLMDASSSMMDPISDQDPKSKMQQVAESAASGIFDLQRLHNNQDAWVTAFKFDDRVEKMFEESVGGLISRFDKDVNKFSAYLYDELSGMLQGTDINAALKKAYDYIDGFLQKRLNFPVKNYIPMYQPILRGDSASSVSIPNIRVMMYTDGRQYDAHGDKHLKQNPFAHPPPPGLNHDVLIGAFFGRAADEGCSELQGLLSNCPIHDDTKQFFLFDTPKKIDLMKHLFRMASGASGFCPLCLGKELRR
jgi:Bacterial Ig domain